VPIPTGRRSTKSHAAAAKRLTKRFLRSRRACDLSSALTRHGTSHRQPARCRRRQEGDPVASRFYPSRLTTTHAPLRQAVGLELLLERPWNVRGCADCRMSLNRIEAAQKAGESQNCFESHPPKAPVEIRRRINKRASRVWPSPPAFLSESMA